MPTIPTSCYLHSDKDTMYELGRKLGLTGEALSQFKYACCEVKVDIIVDTRDGLAHITQVEGRKVES